MLDKSTVTFLKIHKPKTLGSKQAFSMLAFKMAAALLVLANWKSGTVKLAGSLDLFPPVSPVNLFTSVKWEQLFLYMFQLDVMGGNSSGWLGSS